MIRDGGGRCGRIAWSPFPEWGERDAEEGEMLCFFPLEVGHVHSVAFVTGDRPINHVRARVDARWLCSAGGASLWVPGLQPRCSGPVLTLRYCSSGPSALRLSETPLSACPLCTPDSPPSSFNFPSPYLPALGTCR